MDAENKRLTEVEADLENLEDMLKHFDAFSALDLKRMLNTYETGESDEV